MRYRVEVPFSIHQGDTGPTAVFAELGDPMAVPVATVAAEARVWLDSDGNMLGVAVDLPDGVQVAGTDEVLKAILAGKQWAKVEGQWAKVEAASA
jgi:hypothetical protein